MAVENPPIDVYPGESKELLVTVQNEDDNLKPLDMTNATLKWELYREPNHALLTTKTDAADVFLQDATNGVVQVNIYGSDTQNLQLGKTYNYYLRVIDNYGKSTVVAKAPLNVKN